MSEELNFVLQARREKLEALEAAGIVVGGAAVGGASVGGAGGRGGAAAPSDRTAV